MLDNNGVVLDRIRKIESRNVSRPSLVLRIKDEPERGGNKQEFKEKLNEAFASKRKIETKNEKVENPSVIIDSSLTNRINEQKIIAKLVEEKFVNNPNIKDKIEFPDKMTVEEKIINLLEDVEDIEIKKTASELLLEQLELTIKKINNEE